MIIRSVDGRDLGRGLTAYGHAAAGKIAGRKSAEITGILGFEGRAEIVHRDDMALVRK